MGGPDLLNRQMDSSILNTGLVHFTSAGFFYITLPFNNVILSGSTHVAKINYKLFFNISKVNGGLRVFKFKMTCL